jgi:transcriptional regulator with XRE-family HTH domain
VTPRRASALGWTQSDLEKAYEVSKKTIADFEREERIPYVRTLAAIQRALETAGIEFLDEDGVRLSAQDAPKGGSSPAGARKPRCTGKSAGRS